MSHVIAGARSTIEDPDAALLRIQEWAKAHGADVLAADARAVFGRDHLESAARHAERARDADVMGARSIAMETLRYLSGQRQVADAIRVAGLQKGTHAIALALWGVEDAGDLLAGLGWKRDDAVLEASGKSLEVLGVDELERGTVADSAAADLALERVALLDILK